MNVNEFSCFCWLIFAFNNVSARITYKKEEHIESSLVFVDCLRSLTSTASLISEDLEETYLATEITKHINIPLTIEQLNGRKSQRAPYILFSSSLQFYRAFLENTRMEDQLYLIVVWPKSDSVNFAGMQDLFSEVWKHETYKIIILNQDKLDINVYTFHPYSNNRCEAAGPPELIDTWISKERVFSKGTALSNFNKNVLKTLHGCPVKCLVQNYPPEAVVTKFKNGSINFAGSGGVILSSLMKRYNFTLSVQMVDRYGKNKRDNYGYKIFKASKNDFANALTTKTSDLAFGVFSYLTHFSPKVDFSEHYLVKNFAFFVPCGTKGNPSIWKNYYLEFSFQVWVILIFLIIFFSLVFKFITLAMRMEEDESPFLSFWNNLFNLFAVYVESPVKMKTFICTLRFCLILVMMYCTILSVAYKASLKSFLMAPEEAGSIETWEELEQSDMTITGLPASFEVLTVISKNDPTLGKIIKRFKTKTAGEFSDIVEAVTIKRNTAYFGSESMIMFFNREINKEKGTLKQTLCQLNRVVASSPATPFLMRKGSPFQHLIKRVTVDHVHAGHIRNSNYKAEKTKQTYKIKREEKKYSIHQLKGVFILWVFGLFVSVVEFIFEVLIFYFNSNRISKLCINLKNK